MHPIFQRLFVAPIDCRPLKYEGTENKRWKNGILRAFEGKPSWPVHEGIPNFVPSSVEAWSQSDIEMIRKDDWIRRNWETQVAEAEGTSERVGFFKSIAEETGIILDVASGPGGGNMPGAIHYNPKAKILMTDLGVRVLYEGRSYLKKCGLGGNVCFAAFDAAKMPIRSNSFDIVTSRGGFNNIPTPYEALKEAYRVLKHDGALLIMEGPITEASLSKVPANVVDEWRKVFPQLGLSYEKMLENSGFYIVSCVQGHERALARDEAELPRLASQYGVTLHSTEYCIRAVKT